MNQMVTYFASDVETIDLVRDESIVSFLLNKDHLIGGWDDWVIFSKVYGSSSNILSKLQEWQSNDL